MNSAIRKNITAKIEEYLEIEEDDYLEIDSDNGSWYLRESEDADDYIVSGTYKVINAYNRIVEVTIDEGDLI